MLCPMKLDNNIDAQPFSWCHRMCLCGRVFICCNSLWYYTAEVTWPLQWEGLMRDRWRATDNYYWLPAPPVCPPTGASAAALPMAAADWLRLRPISISLLPLSRYLSLASGDRNTVTTKQSHSFSCVSHNHWSLVIGPRPKLHYCIIHLVPYETHLLMEEPNISGWLF